VGSAPGLRRLLFINPAISARRMPVSQNSRMIAVSRRTVNDRPDASFSSALICSMETTGTGSSGTVGGLRFDRGDGLKVGQVGVAAAR
jgi:hypothetical protein